MPAPLEPTQARRAPYALACILLGIGAWLLLVASGCLNPRPDEYPSSSLLEPGVEQSTGPAGDMGDSETGGSEMGGSGEENPLLAGGAPADPEPATVPPSLEESNADAGRGDAGAEPDAGSSTDP